jgi:hypothetical protein
MPAARDQNPFRKVYYRTIEAAIRWSGLADREQSILHALGQRKRSTLDEFAGWPALRLNVERIHDAILNKELPYGLRGLTVRRTVSIRHPDLTVRHLDLKDWMIRCYPEERPDFLFSETERRMAHPALTAETLRALLDEREALKLQVSHLQAQHQSHRRASRSGAQDEIAITPRAETTYLHLIGGLRDLLLGTSPSGEPYSRFKTQEAIASALVAHFGGRLGVTERTIAGKFAAATKLLRG